MTPKSTLAAGYGGVLQTLFNWAFAPVSVPSDTGQRLQGLAQKGTVVYVGRSAALVTFAFFQYLYLRLGAPIAGAVIGPAVGVWWWWLRPILGRKPVRAPYKSDVPGAIRAGQSAMVFLQKPGSLVASVRTHHDPFPDLVKLQRTLERPIYLVPQLLIWERRARQLKPSLFDILFGEPETPGFFRSLFALIWNRNRAFVKYGEPIDLQQVVNQFEGLDDAVIARKVRGSLHQHLARQTRVVTGPPLKSPERLMVETLRDRGLRANLAEIARERGRTDGSVEAEAAEDLREIAARYTPRMIELFDLLLDWVFNRIYGGVEIDEPGLARVAQVNAQMPIVVCPSHKSHIDYLMVSFIFYNRGLNTPYIAAGLNLAFWPLGPIFRKAGAFFIRRSFKGDRVYTGVLKAYIKKLLKDGVTQEFFVEGTRSRTGKVLLPKFGMLAMEVEGWIEGVRPDFAFVPVWVGYAKIIEGKSYARELAGHEKKAEDIGSLLRAPTVLISRYGRIFVRFDEPVSVAALAAQRGFNRENHTEEEKRGLVRSLGFRIVEGINRVTLITPTGLLCTALLAHDRRGLTAEELVDRLQFLLKLAIDAGGQPSFTVGPGALEPMGEGPVAEAVSTLQHDKSLVMHTTGGEHIYAVVEQSRVQLDYYKNATIHVFVADALFATALLTSTTADRKSIEERTRALSRHLKQEFIYGAGGFANIFERRIERFRALALIEQQGDEIHAVPANAARLRLLADLLVNFVEGYANANEALSLLLKGPMDHREWIKATMERNRAAFLAGRLRKYESLSKVLIENAFALFEELGVVTRAGEKGKQRALASDVASQDAIDARVAEIRGFLVPKAE